MSTLASKALLYGWGALQALRHGRPEVSLGFFGGLGDELLATAPVHEWLDRGAKNVWFFTRVPTLVAGGDPRVRLVPEDPRYVALARRLGAPFRPLSYSEYDGALDRDTPLTEHIIARMCRLAGLRGRVALRPYLHLSEEELARAGRWRDHVVFQTSTMNASVPMRNKQWPVERMQAVVDRVRRNHACVQIGSAGDPLLQGVIDLRGRTSLRETAALLSRARLFVGLVGFLMHLARSAECRAVIVYGGRETPERTGYACNVNVVAAPSCSPCWQRSRCEHGHVCMQEISAERVITAVEGALAVNAATLDVQTADLADPTP